MISLSLDKLLIISIFATYIQEINSIYGFPCNVGLNPISSYSCPRIYEVCKDFKCQCTPTEQLFYNNGQATCRPGFFSANRPLDYLFTTSYGKKNCLFKCPDDFKCDSTSCVCKNERHVPVERLCLEPVYQGVKEKCYISEKAYICNTTANAHCWKGQCECFSHFTYNETAKMCFTTFKNLTAEHCYERCREDQKCVKDNKCVCQNETMVELNNKCTKPNVQSPMEKCYISDRAYICNKTENTHCQNKKCLCVPAYYYNKTLKACLTKKSYTDLYGIKEYKALPGGYCTQEGECIDGLRCQFHKCRCPVSCIYDGKKFACDCGAVEFQTPPMVITTGVFLGIVSVCFWIWVIRKTIPNLKSKPATELENVPISETDPIPSANPFPSATPFPSADPALRDARRSPPEINGPIEDLPPSYSDAMLNNPTRPSAPTYLPAGPLGFSGEQIPHRDEAYPLKPI